MGDVQHNESVRQSKACTMSLKNYLLAEKGRFKQQKLWYTLLSVEYELKIFGMSVKSFGVEFPTIFHRDLVTCRFLKQIGPTCGQLVGGLVSSITRGASLVRFEYCRILSTEIILFSALHMFHIIEACKTFRLIPYVTANPAMPIGIKRKKISSEYLLFI